MARRGPDAGGVSIDRHVGLGDRRLAAPNISFQPIEIADESDGDGQLIMVDERLAGVLVRLDPELHADHGGGWFLDAGFGRLSEAAGRVVFVTLEQALEWLELYLQAR